VRGGLEVLVALLAIASAPLGIAVGVGCAKQQLLPPAPVVAIDLTPPPPKPSASVSAKPEPKPRPPLESPYSRWRIAIEVFVPHATPAASVTLDAERRELFAKYITMLHRQVHPVFSARLVPLDDGAPKDALNNEGLSVDVELAIDGATGKVRKFGVARRSSVVDFDAMALDAIKAAEPFEPAPPRLVSPDGNVYVRWTFRRDANEGCSPRSANGYVLRKAPWPP